MFVNMHMKNFNLDDFQNICRACMSEGDLQTFQEGHMKVLNLISKVQYSKTDELPQKICDKCVRKVNDIMSFALLCKRIDQTLKKYLENLKIENIQLDLSPLEPVKYEEITIVEEKIEFIDVNEQVDLDTNYVKLELERIKDELIRTELDEAARAEAMRVEAIRAIENQAEAIRAEAVRAEATRTEVKPVVVTPPIEPISVAQPAAPEPHLIAVIRPPKPRPYKCAHCVRTFTQKGKKRSHEIKIHSAGSKYKCYACATAYSTATALKNHKKTHRPMRECGQCDRYFQSKYHLENHRKTHQDKYEPYECMICFKRFHQLNSYLKHNSVHGSFTCEICDKAFPGAGSLARHKRTHKK